jgi:ABC-type transporter Mla MlaB component
MAGAEVPALCERLARLLDATEADRVDCDLGDLAPADLRTVDVLARLQLTAMRHGSALCLRRAPAAVLELVVLAGLTSILRSGVEVVGQPEQREEAGGVQEEGDAGDPVA